MLGNDGLLLTLDRQRPIAPERTISECPVRIGHHGGRARVCARSVALLNLTSFVDHVLKDADVFGMPNEFVLQRKGVMNRKKNQISG